jgi:transposase
LAADQKKARRERAALVLIDESGLLMAPLVRRTWALRGQTPVLRQRGKHRERVSVAAALAWYPDSSRLALFYETLVNAYYNNVRTVGFLERLLREIPQRLIALWDGGPMHKGDPIRGCVERFAPRLCLERLPAHAPMLNPVERAWRWLKYGRLANFAPTDARHLNRITRAALDTVAQDQDYLRSFWHTSQLPWPD